VPKAWRATGAETKRISSMLLFRVQCQVAYYTVACSGLLARNEYYENVRDSRQYVEHDPKDKTIVRAFHGGGGDGNHIVDFVRPVKAACNVENWLMTDVYITYRSTNRGLFEPDKPTFGVTVTRGFREAQE